MTDVTQHMPSLTFHHNHHPLVSIFVPDFHSFQWKSLCFFFWKDLAWLFFCIHFLKSRWERCGTVVRALTLEHRASGFSGSPAQHHVTLGKGWLNIPDGPQHLETLKGWYVHTLQIGIIIIKSYKIAKKVFCTFLLFPPTWDPLEQALDSLHVYFPEQVSTVAYGRTFLCPTEKETWQSIKAPGPWWSFLLS